MNLSATPASFSNEPWLPAAVRSGSTPSPCGGIHRGRARPGCSLVLTANVPTQRGALRKQLVTHGNNKVTGEWNESSVSGYSPLDREGPAVDAST